MKQKDLHEPIDLVYTWVDGDDPEYLKLINKYAQKPIDLNPERIRDFYEMIKYSLRSVEKYASWVNHIYIFTCRPQKPRWLDIHHPKISVVHHDEVLDPTDVPTFNYNVIESYIHKIPGLSEDFIYLNDDFFFGSDVYPLDFYSRDGKVLIHGTLFGENFSWRVYNKKNDIIGTGLIEHSPFLIRKSWWQGMQDVLPELFQEIKLHKFREGTDVMAFKAYRWYALKYQSKHCKAIKLPDLLKIHSFHKITNNFEKQKRLLKWLEKKAPKFFCLNDDQKKEPNQKVVKLINDFLVRKYPVQSTYEK